MSAYVAFLRSINVGGRRVTKDMLVDAFHAFGAREVWTFLASGNVGFAIDDADGLTRRLEAHLGVTLGMVVPVFVRDAARVRGIAGSDPLGPDAGTRHVAFAHGPLDAGVVSRLDAVGSATDRFVADGTELYWYVQGAFAASPFAGPKLERVVGVPLTVRKGDTLVRLAARLTP